jgi:hypothetical protein
LYTISTRTPVIMPCCFSTICLECWNASFKQIYECPMACGRTISLSAKNPIINEPLLLMVQSQTVIRL